MRNPFLATEAASVEEIQTLCPMSYGVDTKLTTLHYNGFVRQRKVPGEDHFLPNYWGLALSDKCAVGSLCKDIECTVERPACRVKLLLSSSIIHVAFGI